MKRALIATTLVALTACQLPMKTQTQESATRVAHDQAATVGKPALTIAQAKQAVLATLSDPDSAKFRNMRVQPNTNRNCTVTNMVCGEVNYRGKFGGYEGYQPFYVNPNGYVLMWDCNAPKASDVPSCPDGK